MEDLRVAAIKVDAGFTFLASATIPNLEAGLSFLASGILPVVNRALGDLAERLDQQAALPAAASIPASAGATAPQAGADGGSIRSRRRGGGKSARQVKALVAFLVDRGFSFDQIARLTAQKREIIGHARDKNGAIKWPDATPAAPPAEPITLEGQLAKADQLAAFLAMMTRGDGTPEERQAKIAGELKAKLREKFAKRR